MKRAKTGWPDIDKLFEETETLIKENEELNERIDKVVNWKPPKFVHPKKGRSVIAFRRGRT